MYAEEEAEETPGEGHYQKPYKKLKKRTFTKKQRGATES
jgi:hypothetical protein